VPPLCLVHRRDFLGRAGRGPSGRTRGTRPCLPSRPPSWPVANHLREPGVLVAADPYRAELSTLASDKGDHLRDCRLATMNKALAARTFNPKFRALLPGIDLGLLGLLLAVIDLLLGFIVLFLGQLLGVQVVLVLDHLARIQLVLDLLILLLL